MTVINRYYWFVRFLDTRRSACTSPKQNEFTFVVVIECAAKCSFDRSHIWVRERRDRTIYRSCMVCCITSTCVIFFTDFEATVETRGRLGKLLVSLRTRVCFFMEFGNIRSVVNVKHELWTRARRKRWKCGVAGENKSWMNRKKSIGYRWR